MILKNIARYLPPSVKAIVKAGYYHGRHPAHPFLRKVGTLQDLYYWVNDGNIDTMLVLQNYFSAFFPELNTDTQGTVLLYDKEGELLTTKSFPLVKYGAAKFRISSLLGGMTELPDSGYGTLEVKIDIPNPVLLEVTKQQPFYFWDRFYIGYVNNSGQACFTHGVDKTHIYQNGTSEPVDWHRTPSSHQWTPEIPVDLMDYRKFSVVMINRTSHTSNTILTLSDTADNFVSQEAQIPPKGVHRFELCQTDVNNLNPKEMRFQVIGMASQFGRPMVFKEFSNGTFSAMHC